MKLTTTQTALLNSAAEHAEGLLVDFPPTLRGGAKTKTLDSLLNAGLIRAYKSGHRLTNEGYVAVGRTPVAKPAAKKPSSGTTTAKPSQTRVATAKPARTDTKQALVVAMLQRKEGATIAQIQEATDWQAHTVRGALAGALKKKLGLNIVSTKEAGAERVYRTEGDAR